MSLKLFDTSDAAVWARSCDWINATAEHNPALQDILGPLTRLSLSAALAIIRTNDEFDDALAADSYSVKLCVSRLVERIAFKNNVDLAMYPEQDQEKLERIIIFLIDCCVTR
jgi:hypothetical protein